MGTLPTPKATTRHLLMQAGRQLLEERGMGELTVRAVANAAGANLGSFVYHFGTRDTFIEQLLEHWYAPLMSRLLRVAGGDASPLERLRHAVLQLVDFSIEHEVFAGRIFTAALGGDRHARRFLGSMADRHPRLLIQLIVDAQQRGDLIDEDPIQVACFLFSSIALPRLLAAGWQGPPLFNKTFSTALGRVARDRDRIEQRLDWALQGLSPRGDRSP